MNTAAPQAPVSQSSKNRKTSGISHSAALEHGPNKGSTAFQKLVSARVRLKNDTGHIVEKNAGVEKGDHILAVLLKASRQGARNPNPPEILSDAKSIVEAGTAKDKLDWARKAARAKSLPTVTHAGQDAGNSEALQTAVAAGKELKRDSGEPAKAPVIDTGAAASRGEPLIRIVDLRRAEKSPASAEAAATGTAGRSPSSDKDPATPVALRLGAARDPATDTLAKPAPVSASHAQTPLERLREMAGSELVRASSLVLKDGGGEIRLVLKPESLGSVRIRMNIVDNAIEGRIIVDSAAVKHVFDGSVDALRRALTAEGFQTGSLQVSVGGQNADTGGRQQQEQAPAEVRRISAQGFERNIPGVENVSLGDLFVNMFA